MSSRRKPGSMMERRHRRSTADASPAPDICTEAGICLPGDYKFSCLNQLMVNCMAFRFAGSVHRRYSQKNPLVNLRYSPGRVVKGRPMSTDTSKRNSSEAAWLRAVVETAVDGVILIDAAGCVLMFNPACEKLFQYQDEEVIGQNVKMLMPGQYRDAHDGYLDNFHCTGERKIIGIGREVIGR